MTRNRAPKDLDQKHHNDKKQNKVRTMIKNIMTTRSRA